MSSETSSPLPPVDWSAFAGIAQPGCTQVPDEVLDWIMAYLTGAELKVLLYIVRRTFGFKKDADAISLDQLCHGIVRHDGPRPGHRPQASDRAGGPALAARQTPDRRPAAGGPPDRLAPHRLRAAAPSYGAA
jgi:hypothetical protein